MRAWLRLVGCVLAIIFCGQQLCAAQSSLAVLTKYENTDGSLDIKRLQADYKAQRDHELAAKGNETALARATNGDTANAKSIVPPVSKQPSFQLLLRQNFSDVGLFQKPAKPSQAKGAEISWSRDNISHDSMWSFHGMLAAAINIGGKYATNAGPSIVGFTAAPYIQFDRESHSNQINKNIDTITGGGAGEIGFDNLLGGEQYFRGRLAIVEDRVKNTTIANGTLEWLPVYAEDCIGFPCPLKGTSLIYRFQPGFKLQYDSAVGTKMPLAFSNRFESFRVGPEFTLLYQPFGTKIPIIERMHGKTTFHWAMETYSRRRLWLLDTSVTYDLDDAGYIGLTGSYQKGSTEEAGQDIDLYKIALTGKF
jgi:hypothetical protein